MRCGPCCDRPHPPTGRSCAGSGHVAVLGAMTKLDNAIAAADQFLRWARYAQDRPCPERLEQERMKLMKALEEMGDPR